MSRGYYDAHEGAELVAGMYLRTPTNGRTWRITTARKMRSKYPNRWAIEMERVDPEEVQPHEFVLPFFWYRRGPSKKKPKPEARKPETRELERHWNAIRPDPTRTLRGDIRL